MRATVLVRPEAGHPRPAGTGGRATRCATSASRSARPASARLVDLEVDAADPAEARAAVERMCEQLLANPLIESYEIEMTAGLPVSGARPTIAVVVFPGSNDDRDAAWALGSLGADAGSRLARGGAPPESVGAVVLPGGFSYGDYLRCGAIARFSPVMRAVAGFAAEGGPVLGICNGFQMLCEAGLLPGTLRPNASLSFVCRDVAVRVERAAAPFTSRCTPGQRLVIPVKHGEGCWYAPPELVAELEAEGRIVLRYDGDNPNGSVGDVAGVVNEDGNVMGLMPHPEHAVDPLLGSGRRRADPRLARGRGARADVDAGGPLDG